MTGATFMKFGRAPHDVQHLEGSVRGFGHRLL